MTVATQLDRAGHDEDNAGAVAADSLARTINTMNDREIMAGFVERMAREHRTLQQNFTRLAYLWLVDLAQRHKHGLFDARNEASCALAAKIVKEHGEVPPLPLI